MPLTLDIDHCGDIQHAALEDITPYFNNPRRNERAVKYVARSIDEFGFQSPIIVDINGVILAGHTRYQAAKKLKLETVPVIVADLDPEQARAYRLADNKTAEKASWDKDALAEELEAITAIDMEALGFDFDFDTDADDIADVVADGFTEPELPTQTEAVQCPECGAWFDPTEAEGVTYGTT